MRDKTLSAPPRSSDVEVWGGVECTYHSRHGVDSDQLRTTGHLARASDLDLFAALGIRAIRYPVQWQRVMASATGEADWSWTDERLSRLRALGIQPIAGLVHHGSGPRGTDLLDPCFAEGLAAFARAVAERYPWITDYTPVNEPLTTARFCGLYGHWHPHEREPNSFGRMLVNQCRAVAMAMRAIREVNPSARLIQTEDIGKTYSTPTLAYQAEFDNNRRWITFDLLCGRLDRDHPMWGYLHHWCGVPASDLAWFRENPCPPDILGIDYYVTSERFLDHRLQRYPNCPAPGNGRHAYVDVEAVRACSEGITGAGGILREAWQRYHIPLALTEAHIACTREEQMRWLHEVWTTVRDIRGDAVDVRAITAWSLLGATDWDSLLTEVRGHYETGIFDVRSGTPRPTALAGMLRAFADGVEVRHPVLTVPGWWRRPDRLLFPPARRNARGLPEGKPEWRPAGEPAPLLIAGTGTLADVFDRACAVRAIPVRLLARQDMDIADPEIVDAALDALRPWAIVNAAGFARVHDAERRPLACYRDNAQGAEVLARACARRNLPFMTFSTDLVFGGGKQAPYIESDLVEPRNVYGRSKAEAERRVREVHPAALVVRSGPFFGPWDAGNFLTAALSAVAAGRCHFLPDDHIISPTYLPDLVSAALDLLLDGESGLWHLANPGAVSQAGIAGAAAELAEIDARGVQGRSGRDGRWYARMPEDSVLGSEHGNLLPPLEDALARYVESRWANVTGIPVVGVDEALDAAATEENATEETVPEDIGTLMAE